MDPTQIASYYDDFAAHQQKVSCNERHITLLKKLKELGMNKSSSLLELGCGIGTITSLISKVVRNGFVEAVDISPKSIELAKKHLQCDQVVFKTANITSFKPEKDSYDFVTLFDVLEHIPMEDHASLFKLISNYMRDNSLLLINIPNPDYVEYDKKHHPESLQIIDQALPAEFIIKNGHDAGLKLKFFNTYSIWVKDDYQLISFQKARPFDENKLSENRNIIEKIIHKLSVMKDKWIYM